jgi:ectoine hydroxylase-related dioxygenase (phytanoyl-CoA dioxygenase family)
MTLLIAERFHSDGFVLVSPVLPVSECDAALSHIRRSSAAVGSRCLLVEPWCAELAKHLHAHSALTTIVPLGHVAVQCTYFEKSMDLNWLVPMHQDLSVPVARRIEHAALSGWSRKEDVWFVHAPTEVLSHLVAVRLHLDACGPQDGPLRVVPGSHRHGRLDTAAQAKVRGDTPEVSCVGDRGSVLALRPLLLHASSKSTGTSRRRVLQFLYGPRCMPYGLTWHTAE